MSIQFPPPEAPALSVFTSGAVRAVNADGGRWKGAGTARFLPEAFAPAYGWPNRGCATDPASVKAQTDIEGMVEFDGIGIYSDVVCTNSHPSFTEFGERSSSALAMNWQYVLSEELMDGKWSALASGNNRYGNPTSNGAKGSTIRAAATTIAGGPVGLREAIASLIREWTRPTVDVTDPGAAPEGLRSASTPVIHIPTWGLGFLPDGGTERKGRQITTNYGTARVGPGPGYSGNPPGTDALVEMDPNTFWAYITGPIIFDSSILPDPNYIDGLDGWEPRTNQDGTNIKEVNAIAAFDTSAVYGILVEGP